MEEDDFGGTGSAERGRPEEERGRKVGQVLTGDDQGQVASQIGTVYDASKRKQSTLSDVNKMSSTPAPPVHEEELPQVFQVKYLGHRDARGLWGIKHTRKPVDSMVSAAKALKPGTVLPIVKLGVSKEGVCVTELGITGKKSSKDTVFHPIDTISYGVQDLVYTRVFSMIVVRDGTHVHPFECHAFVCDSRSAARKLTYSLAAAFHEYSKHVKGEREAIKRKFAIDLRSPEEIEADMKAPADSEA